MNLSATDLEVQPDFQNFFFESLNLSHNRLTSLNADAFPRGLKHLDLGGNMLWSDSLPNMFPDTLEVLNLRKNPFSTLREIQMYPSHLKQLHLHQTNLDTLEGFDCDSIERLLLHHTNLKILMNLPRRLLHLEAYSCRIRLLPNRLPTNLRILDVSRNDIRFAGLPRYWGESLEELYLSENNLERFPIHLPDSLRILHLSMNKLTEIPETLPHHLEILCVNDNQLRKLPLKTRSKPLRFVNVSRNQLTQNVFDENIRLRWAVVLQDDDNWNEWPHKRSAPKIQKRWRLYRMKKRLRAWRRVANYKDELFQVSMMPERVWQIDDLSPEWRRQYKT